MGHPFSTAVNVGQLVSYNGHLFQLSGPRSATGQPVGNSEPHKPNGSNVRCTVILLFKSDSWEQL